MGILHRTRYILGVFDNEIPFYQLESYAYGFAEREAGRVIDMFDAVRIGKICAAGGEDAGDLQREFRHQINERAFKKRDPTLERLEQIRNERGSDWERQDRWERRMRERKGLTRGEQT